MTPAHKDHLKSSDIQLVPDTMAPEAPMIRIRTNESRHYYTKQVLAALAVSLGPFASGLSKGYSSPAIASMQDNSTSTQVFTVNDQEASWIASLSFLGAIVGAALGGLAMKAGRRSSLLFAAPPYTLAWLLTALANSTPVLYAASFLGGVACSLIGLVSQVYVSEIAEPEIRGTLSAVSKILSQFGVLISFTLGACFNWHHLALCIALAPIALFLTAIYIPETPSHLLMKGRDADAASSLQWLRGPDVDISIELATIRANILASKQFSGRQRFKMSTLFSPKLFNCILITCGLMVFQRFSGAQSFNFYAVSIFRKTLGSMNAHGSAIAVSAVQLFASCLSGALIDRIGRLPLLIVSSVLMSFAMAGFGTYIYYYSSDITELTVPGTYDWLALVCVIIFTLAFSLGISPISWLLIGELYPLEYRHIGSAISAVFSYLCAFVGIKTFVDLQELIGLYGTFWLYSVISVFGLLFVVCFVPETKGIKIDEMNPRYIDSLIVNR